MIAPVRRFFLATLLSLLPLRAHAQYLLEPQAGVTAMPRGGFGCSLGTGNSPQSSTSTDWGLGAGVVEKNSQIGLLWMHRTSPDNCLPEVSTLAEDDFLVSFRVMALRPATIRGEPLWLGAGVTFGTSFITYDQPQTHSGHQSYPASLEASAGVPFWSYGESPEGEGHHWVLEAVPTLGWRFDPVSTDRGDLHLDGFYFHLGLRLAWKPSVDEDSDE